VVIIEAPGAKDHRVCGIDNRHLNCADRGLQDLTCMASGHEAFAERATDIPEDEFAHV
jgi:hypothetical protein